VPGGGGIEGVEVCQVPIYTFPLGEKLSNDAILDEGGGGPGAQMP
jgi:hypothetical protein